MSNIIFYDPNSIVVNRVIRYLQSVNTPDYENQQNILINPDVSLLVNVSMKYWKVDSINVVEMSLSEKALIDDLDKAKTFRENKFRVATYDTFQRLISIVFFDTDNGDGTYSGKAEENLYTYFNETVVLLTKVVKTFYYDGTEASIINYEYFKNDNNEVIEKKV